MATGSEWVGKVGEAWARNYQRTDRALSGVTQHLLEKLLRIEGDAIVDIGCGAGELALALARSRPTALVTGVDISPALIEAARERTMNLPNTRFALADAASWAGGGERPDLIVSRHGVMFFDDPVGAFTNIRRLARTDAQLVFSCFRDPSLNLWATGVSDVFGIPAADDAEAPGPFAFAEGDRVRSILAQSGWRDIDVQPVDFAFVAGMGESPVEDAVAFFSEIGPGARALREMPESERAAAMLRLRLWVARHSKGTLAAFPGAAWIVSARNPG